MDNIEKHKTICSLIHDLYKTKNHDYGDSFHKSFIEWGLPMVCIRLGDKYNRFCNLVKNDDSQVSDESICDTLMDLANYAIMTIMEIDKEEKK